MIDRIVVRNWQSLRHVDLALGRFTVIVGPSSSGKTALMRAFRAVASNVRGPGNITRGAKVAVIAVSTGDQVVTLERTQTSGTYHLTDPGGEGTYTKLAGSVPADVTRVLRIQPVPTGGSSINFAGQFDRPFLLDDSGANVARVLGELTNVTTIFKAVQEANRARNSLAATLRVKEQDHAVLAAEIAQYADLPARIARLDDAERLADEIGLIGGRIERLRTMIDALEYATSRLDAARAEPEAPFDATLLDAYTRLSHFRNLLGKWRDNANKVRQFVAEIDESGAREGVAVRRLHMLLLKAGTCPTCGQSTASPPVDTVEVE